jgi:zinc protease
MKRILLLLAAALTLSAQTTPATTHVWETLKYAPLRPLTFPNVDEITLSNGMRVLLLENHEVPMVRGVALVRTGNLFDPKGKVGLASLTGTALRSGGTDSKTGDQIDEDLENIAASVESGIGETTGTVSFSCLKENAAQVIAVFEDLLAHPAFRQNRIDLIKQQMMSEITRRNDDPGEIAQREFADIVYGRDNSYGWPEDISDILAIQRPDVVAFYQRYFFPANIMLAVQGDFDTAQMKAQLESIFKDWTVKQAPVPPFPKVHFDYKPGTYLADKQDVTQTNFEIGQPGGELNNPDYPALEVMSDILGGGFNSRLFRRLRTQLGYVYGINASWGANYDHPGLFRVSGSTQAPTTVPAIQAAMQEVERMRQEPVTDQELEGAKETVLNSFVFYFDTPGKTISRLLTYYYFGYPKDFIFNYQKAVKTVTKEDVLRVAKKYLDPAKFVTVAVGNPKDFGEPLTKLGQPVTPIDLTIPMPAAMRRNMPQGMPPSENEK